MNYGFFLIHELNFQISMVKVHLQRFLVVFVTYVFGM